jgi:RHS repeat-associated protein
LIHYLGQNGQCEYVRFGLRDYDPFTGRFTAKDPLGYAAGDPDLCGYCVDDPVNAVDPTGMFFFLPFLAGLGGATALAGVGAIGAGLAADGLNYFFGDKEKEAGKDGLRSTKGAAKGWAWRPQ